jgi:Class II flagellar assembly regulator
MTGIPALGAPPPASAHGAPRVAATPTRVGFAVPAAATPAAGSGSAGAAAPVAALAGLLALQETEPAAARDRVARRHGRAMLAALAAWQRALLGEAAGEAAAGPPAALDRLGELLTTVPTAADPGLAAVLDAVVLRCRIELARRE